MTLRPSIPNCPSSDTERDGLSARAGRVPLVMPGRTPPLAVHAKRHAGWGLRTENALISEGILGDQA